MNNIEFQCSLHPNGVNGELLTPEWCEENCEKYYHCDTVAWAMDEEAKDEHDAHQ